MNFLKSQRDGGGTTDFHYRESDISACAIVHCIVYHRS